MIMRAIKEIIEELPPRLDEASSGDIRPGASLSLSTHTPPRKKHRDLDLGEDVMGAFKALAFQADWSDTAEWVFGSERMDRHNDDILEDTDYLPDLVRAESSVITDMDFLMIISSYGDRH